MNSPLAARVPALWWALALACPVAAALATWHFAVDVPFWDQWDWLDRLYGGGGAFDLARYWPLMNEHRVVVPLILDRLLFDLVGIDMRVRALLKIPLSLVMLGSLVVLFRHTAPRASAGRAAVVFSALLFSMAYWPMWADPRNYAVHLAQSLTVVAVTVVATRPVSQRAWLAAAACSLAAGWSTTAGILAWPVVLGVLWWRGHRRGALWVWMGVAAMVIAPHAIDLLGAGRVMEASGPAPTARDVLKFALAFFGHPVAPVAESLRYWPTMAAGALGLVLLALVVTLDVRRREWDLATCAFPWYALAAWSLLIGVLITLGRSVGGPAAALESRFAVAATPFWVSLAALALLTSGRDRSEPAPGSRHLLRRIVWVVLVGGYLAAGVDGFLSGGADRLALRLATGRHCVANLVEAPDACLQLLYPDPGAVRRLAPLVAQHPSSLASWPGAPMVLRGSWGDSFTFDVHPAPDELPIAEARVIVTRHGEIDRVPARDGGRVTFPVITLSAPTYVAWHRRLPVDGPASLVTGVRERDVALFDRWRSVDAVAYVDVATVGGRHSRVWSRQLGTLGEGFEVVDVDLAQFVGSAVEIRLGVDYSRPSTSRFAPRPIVEWVPPGVQSRR